MKLSPQAIALSLGITSAIVSVICVIFIAAASVATMNFFGWLVHIDNLADILGPRSVTLGNAIAGIVAIFISAYIVGWLFATLYNKFSK